MSADTDHDRIAIKAHEIWDSEGRPHGRDQAHWDQAKEIIALHDSMGDTLLPRETGAFEPEEPTQSVENNGDIPGITDQGRDDLVDIDREPEITKPSHATHSLGDTAGHVARSRRDETPDIDDRETVTPPLKVATVTPTPSNPMLGEPAPRQAVKGAPDLEKPQAIVPDTPGTRTSGTAPSASGPTPKTSGAATGLGIAPVGAGAATSGTAPTPRTPPTGTSAPITAKGQPKPPSSPAPVTKGKPGGRR